jgi:hypothetical protein
MPGYVILRCFERNPDLKTKHTTIGPSDQHNIVPRHIEGGSMAEIEV